MAQESTFVATSPILAKILKETSRSPSPEKIPDIKISEDSLTKEQGNSERNIAFQFEDFITKLQTSPRISYNSAQGTDSSEVWKADSTLQECEPANSSSALKATGKSAEQTADAYSLVDISWKADSHGFYQSPRSGDFLLRFSELDGTNDSQEKDSDRIAASLTREEYYAREKCNHFELTSNFEDALLQNQDKPINYHISPTLADIPLVFIQAPTPSDLSRRSSSLGSSRPETPEPGDRSDIADVSGSEFIETDGEQVTKMSEEGNKENEISVCNLREEKEEREHVEGNDTTQKDILDRDYDKYDVNTKNRMPNDYYGHEDNDMNSTKPIVTGNMNSIVDPDFPGGLEEAASFRDENDQDCFISNFENSEGPNESNSSMDQANNSLMTSWSEHQLVNVLPSIDFSDTVSFVRKTESSPTITWGSTMRFGGHDALNDDRTDVDIFQSSIGSATDLRELLERSNVLTEIPEDFDDESDRYHEYHMNDVSEGSSLLKIEKGHENKGGRNFVVSPILGSETEETESILKGTFERKDEMMESRSKECDQNVDSFEEKEDDILSYVSCTSENITCTAQSLDMKQPDKICNGDKINVQDEGDVLIDTVFSGLKVSEAEKIRELNNFEDDVIGTCTPENVMEKGARKATGDEIISETYRSMEATRINFRQSYNDWLNSMQSGVSENVSVGVKTWEYSVDAQLGTYFDNSEVLSLLRTVESERVRLEAVRDIRQKIEETCNQLPIEKIPMFVYEKWQDLLQTIASDGESSYQALEEEYDDNLRGMRLELDQLTKENFNLSKIVTDVNSYKLENELLKKQIDGLEEYVSSMERRMEGRVKENCKMVEEIEQLRRELLEKREELMKRGSNLEGEVVQLMKELNLLKDAKVRLENDVKMKDIEYKKVLTEKERIQDEIQSDVEKINANSNSLRSKIVELQRENETLKTANEADQTVIKHLETKFQKSSDLIQELRNEKSKLLAELQESKVREADLRKDKEMVKIENDAVEKQRDGIIEKLRLLSEEKMSLEKQLNVKLNEDSRSTSAMLKELKSLESSLNSARKEKSLLEDKYNNQKYELERVYKIVEIKKHKKQNSAADSLERKLEHKIVAGGPHGKSSSSHNGQTLTNSGEIFCNLGLSVSNNSPVTPRSLKTSNQSENIRSSDANGSSLFSHSSHTEDLSETLRSSDVNRSVTTSLSSGTRGYSKTIRSADNRFLSESYPSPNRSHMMESSILRDSTAESSSTYPDYANGTTNASVFPSVSSEVSVPSVLVMRSKDSPLKSSTATSPFSQKQRDSIRLSSQDEENSSVKSGSYTAEDTRSWLRSMETKLEQTDQIIKSMKRSKHVHC